MAFGARELPLDFFNPSLQRQRIGFKQRHTYRLLESGDQPNLIAGNLLFVAVARLGDLHGPPVALQNPQTVTQSPVPGARTARRAALHLSQIGPPAVQFF